MSVSLGLIHNHRTCVKRFNKYSAILSKFQQVSEPVKFGVQCVLEQRTALKWKLTRTHEGLHAHMHAHTHTHACIHTGACACTHTCMHTHTHTGMHTHTHTYMHTRTYKHTHTHTCTHTYKHTHTHTYTQMATAHVYITHINWKEFCDC